MTPIKLINPTDEELSAAVAEHVAGWVNDGSYWGWRLNSGQVKRRCDLPPYATSADAVLPLTMQPLNGRKFYFTANYLLDGWRVWIHFDPFTRHEAKADTLAKAICIALLRAAGHTVEVKP